MGDSLRLAGFLVNPAEIEQVVESPGVRACQVVGATRADKTEVPYAFVLCNRARGPTPRAGPPPASRDGGLQGARRLPLDAFPSIGKRQLGEETWAETVELSNQLGTVEPVEACRPTLGMLPPARRQLPVPRRVHTTEGRPLLLRQVFLESALFRKHRAQINAPWRRCWTIYGARLTQARQVLNVIEAGQGRPRRCRFRVLAGGRTAPLRLHRRQRGDYARLEFPFRKVRGCSTCWPAAETHERMNNRAPQQSAPGAIRRPTTPGTQGDPSMKSQPQFRPAIPRRPLTPCAPPWAHPRPARAGPGPRHLRRYRPARPDPGHERRLPPTSPARAAPPPPRWPSPISAARCWARRSTCWWPITRTRPTSPPPARAVVRHAEGGCHHGRGRLPRRRWRCWWRARKTHRGLRSRHRAHHRPVLALFGALHLRHRGQHHRARHGGARRQELVFPDGGLRLRLYAASLGHRSGQGQWRHRAGRGAPSAGLVGLRLLSAAGPGQPRAGHRAGQRGRRHGQRDQGGQRIRADPRRPEDGRPAATSTTSTPSAWKPPPA